MQVLEWGCEIFAYLQIKKVEVGLLSSHVKNLNLILHIGLVTMRRLATCVKKDCRHGNVYCSSADDVLLVCDVVSSILRQDDRISNRCVRVRADIDDYFES